MPFDTNKTVESWKKAKPLLLHNTGVSDVIRSIPSKPTAQQLGEFDKIEKKLEGFMADPKIKSEKKAFACLQSIRQDIKTYLGYTQTTRKSTVTKMERVLTVAQKYCQSIEKGPLTPELVETFHSLMAFKKNDGVKTEMDYAAVPQDVLALWIGGDVEMQRAVNSMKNVAAGSTRPQPKWDTKAEMKKCIGEYKEAGGQMDRAMKATKALG